jgi:vitamin B12 transporter
VTWFHNGFRDLIDYAYDAETWKYVAGNRRRAVTEGLETLLEARPFEGVVAHAAYTYLKAEDASTGLRLHRRPRHTGDAGIRYDAKGVWQIGAAVHFVAGRVDFSGAMEDYTTVRAFASLAVSTQLRLQVRAENAFDEDYSEVPGYPGLPFGVFGGVDWRF